MTSADRPGVLSELTREYYATNPARFELRAQLCIDLAAMPVEDASVPWDEHVSPYRRVAILEFPPRSPSAPNGGSTPSA